MELMEFYKSEDVVQEFMDNQLDLFTDLCVGRNYFNIERVREFVRAAELARYIRGDGEHE
jgi:hypothetical protein